jgi:predicted  nucleic acid-binding Zn-ribbon protein
VLRVLELLLQLQSLDTRIETERERIATIEAMVRDRSEYESAKRRFDELKAPAQKLETDQKDLELHLGTARSQRTDAETKLYSGKVGSPRELDDLQRRGDDLRRRAQAGCRRASSSRNRPDGRAQVAGRRPADGPE